MRAPGGEGEGRDETCKSEYMKNTNTKVEKNKTSKHCGFCINIFDNSFDQSKSMVRLVRAEKMVLSGLVTLLNAIEHYRIEHD